MFKKKKKSEVDIFALLFKVKKRFLKKGIPVVIYIKGEEMGIEWERGYMEFSINVSTEHNNGYIKEYKNGRQVLLEEFKTIDDLFKRANLLISRKLV